MKIGVHPGFRRRGVDVTTAPECLPAIRSRPVGALVAAMLISSAAALRHSPSHPAMPTARSEPITPLSTSATNQDVSTSGDGGTVRPEVGPRGRRSHDEMHAFLVVDRQAVEGQGTVDRAADGLVEQHFPGGHLKVGVWPHVW